MALLRALSVAVAFCSIASGFAVPNVVDLTLDDIQRGLQEGCFSSEALVEAYTGRIGEVNGMVQAVTEVNPDAIKIAKQLDQERAENKIRGPLHGVPILLKNNLATKDAMNNTAGSHALIGATVPRDSTVVNKLRDAGAIILGKANLSQWSFYRSFDLPSGWSSHGGQVHGAYHDNQDPNGSSSGSGSATDLGLAAACIGTETWGSLLGPSHRNNIVGIKPTVGLTSRDLLIPVSEHLDTVGPMARTVKDAAYVLQAIAGQDTNDNYTSAIPAIPDYVAACKNESLNVKIGVPWKLLAQVPPSSSAELNAFNESVRVLQEAGATIVDTDFTFPGNMDDFITMLSSDFMTNIAGYFAKLATNPNNITDLRQLREYTKTTPVEQFPQFSVSLWDNVIDNIGFPNTDPRFWTMFQSLTAMEKTQGLQFALESQQLNAVVLPTSIGPQFLAPSGGPGVTVPMGFYPESAPITNSPGDLVDTGPAIPFGLSFLGPRWSEEQLIKMAYVYEQRTQARGQGKRKVNPNTEVKVAAVCQKS
ncbi:hypothetical protein HIM_08257 [Hirsutella minnesotensis 3608]|uniref:Amidase domain-containing protein n=1 Tax=Hirsutella minnesotensis 3608 TaxID=1043627 RepID=A0A0F7ZHB1_9HYPO|nr:hypothetical protein HIM_08257 [Hirsutella minnesotensis 3608]